MASKAQIKHAQELLVRDFGIQMPIDGIWGPLTAAAVRLYQWVFNLPVTGKLDSRTLNQINIHQQVFAKNVPQYVDSLKKSWWQRLTESDDPLAAQTLQANGHAPSGGGGGGGGGGGSDTGSNTVSVQTEPSSPQVSAEAKPDQRSIEEKALDLYGPALAIYLKHPEVGPILREGAANGWSMNRLRGKLEKTKWWRTTRESIRQWDLLVATDPATANAKISAMAASLRDQLHTFGGKMEKKELYALAMNVLRYGLNEAQQRDTVLNLIAFDSGIGGVLGGNMAEIKRVAAQYFIPVDDKTAWNMAKRIASGELDIEDAFVTFRNQAKSRFPTLAEQIDRGLTPADFFATYQQRIAQILEVAPESIDFMSDERWSKILSYADPDQRGTVRNMTLWEAERYARQQKEFRNTKGARDQAFNLASTIAQTFGQVKF